jgi:flavin reductase (DIM6/NTAB) family NADH-FMN oxidoreductase RutF
MQDINAKTFWNAVGQRAMGVSIVTATGASGAAGFLGLSTAHVCADPPLMLVSIDKKTSALQPVLESRHYAINYLAHDQQALADIFGGKSELKGAERFGTASWGKLTSGAPVLHDAAGVIDCVLEEAIERFGVMICIGRVVDFATSSRAPLIFLRGRYLAAPAESEQPR